MTTKSPVAIPLPEVGCTLRPWHAADADRLADIANNPRIARFMTDRFPHPYTQDHAKAFIAMASQDDPPHILAIDRDGEAIGGIGIHPQQDVFRMNAEMGYWLAEPFWGQGIVSAAIRGILPYAFSAFDIDRVFARPFGNNPASMRVLEKCGFILEGRFEHTILKNGERLDELVYAFRRRQLAKPK